MTISLKVIISMLPGDPGPSNADCRVAATAAWKLAPRDDFIGWSQQHREKNLPLVVDNPRLLILPWIKISNLDSHILALVRQCLPVDWTVRY